MLCEKCNKNEAKIHLICVKDSDKEGLWLCDECARDITREELSLYTDEEEALSINGILNGFLDFIGNKEKDKNEIGFESKCDYCGLEYRDFEKSKILGCDKCYSSFRAKLIPKIKKIHFSKKHTGKIPNKIKSKLMFKNSIKELNDELEEAIFQEDYEQAANLRDKIIEIRKDEENNIR